MREYEFAVIICGGYTEGSIYIEANNYDEAYDKGISQIQEELKDLSVIVDIELECIDNPDDEEEEYDGY